jgi:multidrug transporter EmrE-like cation transporter
VGATALLRNARDARAESPRHQAGRILLYAYTAAFAGSLSMLLIKVIGTAVRAAIERRDPERVLLTPGLAGCLCGLALCALVQLGFLHRTLANSPVSYGVPTYQTLLTLLTILVGGIFFNELRTMHWFSMAVFSVGVALAIFGIVLHTPHRSQAEAEAQQRDQQQQQQAQERHPLPPPSAPPPQYGSQLPAESADALCAVEEGAHAPSCSMPAAAGSIGPCQSRPSECSRLLG